MATVASLNVLLKAQTGDLTRGMKGATKGMKRFLVVLEAVKLGFRLTSKVANVFFDTLLRSRQSADDIGKLAANTGLAVEDIQAMRLAAEEGGVSFDKLGGGLRAFSKRLGEAAQGTGEAKTAIEEVLGLDVSKLLSAGPGEALRTILDEISGLETAAERAAVFAKVFSDVGKEFEAAFGGGTETIDRALARLEDMNALLTRFDIRAIESMNDEMNLANLEFEALVQKITASVAPAMIVLTREISAFIAGLLAVDKLSGVFDKVAGGISTAAGALLVARQNLLKTQEAIVRTAIKGEVDAFNASEPGAFADARLKRIQELQAQLKPVLEEIDTIDSVLTDIFSKNGKGIGQDFFLKMQGVREEIEKLLEGTRESADGIIRAIGGGAKGVGGRPRRDRLAELPIFPSGGGVSAGGIPALQAGSVAAVSKIAELLNSQEMERVQEKQLVEQIRAANALEELDKTFRENGVAFAPLGVA